LQLAGGLLQILRADQVSLRTSPFNPRCIQLQRGLFFSYPSLAAFGQLLSTPFISLRLLAIVLNVVRKFFATTAGMPFASIKFVLAAPLMKIRTILKIDILSRFDLDGTRNLSTIRCTTNEFCKIASLAAVGFTQERRGVDTGNQNHAYLE
jgi:hypothetical protein